MGKASWLSTPDEIDRNQDNVLWAHIYKKKSVLDHLFDVHV